MSKFREKLIQNLYDLNVQADIKIEELADDIIENFKNFLGREYTKNINSCPMCEDCPDNCPLDNN